MLTLVLVIASWPALASGDNAPAFYLRGKVEHLDHSEPLSDDLRSGAQFQANKLPQARYASKWFMIPGWFAGTFQADQNVITKMEDCVTGRVSHPNQSVVSYGRELHGYQRDKRGDIWHFYVESGASKSEQTGQITYNNIDWYGPIRISKDRVIMRILATSLIVDKVSGVIVDSFRREDLKVYEPSGTGTIKVSYTSKSFDSRGNARDLQQGYAIHHLIASFKEIYADEDNDYRALFRDYLLNNNMKELVP